MIKLFWEKLLTTIWFIPTVISTAFVAAAVSLLYLDQRLDAQDWAWANAFQIGTIGIRQVLAVTTGAIISLTGVVFSISVVALTLAANQFGSKILHNFLRDTKNKVVLGLLVGSFLYGLALLAFIDTHLDANEHMPIIAFVGSLLLTVMAVIGLIYFTHNISTSIQADQIISLIGQELNQTIEDTLIDLDEDQSAHASIQRWSIATHALQPQTVVAATSGYVEFIDLTRLCGLAEKENRHIELLLQSGDFIIENSPIMTVYGQDDDIDAGQADALRLCISLGRKRTPFSDLEFAIMQLLQIALRALSPGINDSLTAISCIDWLSSSLGRMASKHFPFSYMEDGDGTVRIKKREFGFTDAADAMFHPLRQNARGNEMVMIHLLETISRILQVSRKSSYSDALFHHAELILEAAKASFNNPADTAEIIKRFDKCREIYARTQSGIVVENMVVL